jgi:HEAT repeat protein
MVTPKGKTVAMCAGVVGFLVLVGAGVAIKDRIAEKYWLQKLRNGDAEEKRKAAYRLGALGSLRAVPLLLRELKAACERPRPMLASAAFNGTKPPEWREWDLDYGAIRHSIKNIGEQALPALIRATADENGRFALVSALLMCEVLEPFTCDLDEFPPREVLSELKDFSPILHALVKNEKVNREIRQAAAEALKKIQSLTSGPEDGGE